MILVSGGAVALVGRRLLARKRHSVVPGDAADEPGAHVAAALRELRGQFSVEDVAV
jgi:hypothetical protein